MSANVVKGTHRRIIAADDDDGFVADFEEKVIALVANSIDVTGDQPLSADDLLHVGVEDGIIAVEFAIQAIATLGFRSQRRDYTGGRHVSFSDFVDVE
jgi:hypothetical protein